jgi:hypothetical protein
LARAGVSNGEVEEQSGSERKIMESIFEDFGMFLDRIQVSVT